MGSRLFERNPRRQGLTPAGEAARKWATALTGSADRLVDELAEFNAGHWGEVQLVAALAVASYRLPPLLADFNARFPRVRVVVSVADTDRALELVGEDVADFAIIPIQPRTVGPPLQATELGDEEVLIVAGADSEDPPPLIEAKDLERLPFVEANHGISRRERELRRAGVEHRHIAVKLSHPEAIKEAVRCGLGVAMTPRAGVAEDLAQGNLREIRVDGIRLGLPICLVQREDALELTPAQQRLLEHLTVGIRGGLGVEG